MFRSIVTYIKIGDIGRGFDPHIGCSAARLDGPRWFFFAFFLCGYTTKDTRGGSGPRDGRSRTRWPLTGTSTPCDLTTSTQLASIDMQYDQAPCAFVLHSRFLRRRSNRPRVTGACASLTSSSGSLWRRRAAPPSSRQRRATTTVSLQPRLSSSRAAKEGSQTRQITCRCFWGSTTGLPARGACGSLLFRQDKTEAASYKK